MKIYGHYMSAPANQVRLTASALGQDYDYVHVDLGAGEQKSPDYLTVNRFGRVPAMDDNGFKLAESGAISRYLACKSDCAAYPKDPQKRAEIDQWMDFSAHHIRANMGKVLFNKVFAPMFEMEADQKSLDEGVENLNNNLPVLDAQLAKTPFATGDALTIADTALISAMEPFEMIEYDLSATPNVAKYRERIAGEDWYKNVHAHYAAEMNG
ncbi:MAG: glutathione S-transferase family protein [Pseudomonadota bacterium]